MNQSTIFKIIVISLVFNSCVISKKITLPSKNGIKGYSGINKDSIKIIAIKNQKNLSIFDIEKKYYSKGSDLEWGLSLSGGGVRSAAVNIGVLKGMYDTGLLDKIQIISSVSGGSYASFWLYSNHYNNDTLKFGYSSFNDKVILKNITKLQNTANAYRLPTMIGSLISFPKSVFSKYNNKINRAFSNGIEKPIYLNDFKKTIINKKAPYFIINSTIHNKTKNDWLPSIYEFTPNHIGNAEIGLNTNNHFKLDKAITISGAALKFKLMSKVDNHSTKIKNKSISLSDGGHSENLGAIALIRRGVKNIIIVDAEYDKSYKFGAYTKLKNKINSELSLNLEIPSIDNFIIGKTTSFKTSVHIGRIKNFYVNPNYIESPKEIKIYYLKMSLSQSIKQTLEQNNKYENGKNIYLTKKKKTCLIVKNHKCKKFNNGDNLGSYNSSDFKDLSIYWVKSYSQWLNEESKWKNVSSYQFPQITTADQSFYRDQLTAFIGLGYLESLELIK